MKQLLLFVLLFISAAAYGQREYGICDSTFYTFNADTTLIAGRKKLYVQTATGMTLLRDFAMADTTFYIRDFDIVKPTQWYTLVGRRYIGGETYLYRSADRGQTWALDTSYYAAVLTYPAANNYYNRSINQLQRMGEDSIALFMHYYESGIFFSVDGGNTWREWFRNMQTHYQGILECDYHYYLYSFEGDALRPWMFPFHKSKLFTNIGGYEWRMNADSTHPRCLGTTNDRCIYPYSSINSRCEVYNFFKDTLAEACAALPAYTHSIRPQANELTIYPNPAHDGETMTISAAGIMNIRLLDYTGGQVDARVQQVGKETYTIWLKGYAAGIYTLMITTPQGILTRRIAIE